MLKRWIWNESSPLYANWIILILFPRELLLTLGRYYYFPAEGNRSETGHYRWSLTLMIFIWWHFFLPRWVLKGPKCMGNPGIPQSSPKPCWCSKVVAKISRLPIASSLGSRDQCGSYPWGIFAPELFPGKVLSGRWLIHMLGYAWNTGMTGRSMSIWLFISICARKTVTTGYLCLELAQWKNKFGCLAYFDAAWEVLSNPKLPALSIQLFHA